MKNRKIIIGAALIVFLLSSKVEAKAPPIPINYIVDDLPKNPNVSPYTKRNLSQVEQIILHHYASDGTPQAVANYHVNTNNWPAIGYHFTIDKDGTISQVNELDTISYHVSGQNTRSIGIALEGNFQNETPSPGQLKSVDFLIKHIRSLFPQQLQVFQHSDFASYKPYDANMDLAPYKI